VESVVVKSLAHLALRCGKDVRKLLGSMHQANAAAAATCGRLQHQRETDARGAGLALADAAQHICARQHGQPSPLHGDACLYLVAHRHQGSRGRADESKAYLLADLGEAGVLGEEAVAGVDRLTASDKSGADEICNAEIALAAWTWANANAPICHLHGQRVAVGLRVGDDRLNAELAAGAQHAQCDLAAIGDEHAFEHASIASLS